MPTALLSSFWQKLSLSPLSNSTKQKKESASAKFCKGIQSQSHDSWLQNKNFLNSLLYNKQYEPVQQLLTPYSIFIIWIIPKYKEERRQNLIHSLHISYSSIQLGKDN